MKRILILLCLPLMTLGQNVNIPDANFKAYLVGNTAINTNGDTEIQLSEATAFGGGIQCWNLSISDLTGIEAFTALTLLYCGENQLTSLNVNDNTDLNELDCHNNLLTNLDLSGATALTYLSCNDNQLTNIDVSNNTDLTDLNCFYNELTCLDVSNNTDLNWLKCSNNLLEQLNTKNGNWINMSVDAVSNNLMCVEVDNIGYANNTWYNYFDNLYLDFCIAN